MLSESRQPPMLKSARNIHQDLFDANVELENVYDDFDSDEHIENENDWYDDLDVLSKPHLLGPSATHHSPVPVEFQHRSDFPFVCSCVFITCQASEPIIDYIPYSLYFNNKYQMKK